MVEAALAIAMSAALILLTAGLGTMVNNRRFRDSLTTTQAFIQSQYSDVQSGINSRLADDASFNLFNCGTKVAGLNSSCYVVGRLISLTASGITSSYVIARPSDSRSWPNQDRTGLENLTNGVTLYAVSDSQDDDAGMANINRSFGYGSTAVNAWVVRSNGSVERKNVNESNLLIVRSPVDGSLIIATNVSLGSDALGSRINSTSISGATTNQMIAWGIENGLVGQSGGLICIANNGGSASLSNNNNVNLKELNDSPNKIKEACSNWE